VGVGVDEPSEVEPPAWPPPPQADNMAPTSSDAKARRAVNGEWIEAVMARLGNLGRASCCTTWVLAEHCEMRGRSGAVRTIY
jgi:hypothetical protein